jgi:hypothetical protein
MFRLGRIQTLMLIVVAAGAFSTANAFGVPYVDYHFQVGAVYPWDGYYPPGMEIGSAYIRLDSWAVDRGYASLGDGIEDIVFDLAGDPYDAWNINDYWSPVSFSKGNNVTVTVQPDNSLSFGFFEYLYVYDTYDYDPDTDTYYPYGWPQILQMSDSHILYLWDRMFADYEADGRWVADGAPSAVPEPSTLLLTGGGVLGLLMCGSRFGGRKASGGGT